ncbi:MAG: universal stress protein [Actinomycetota bacterium]|nr:universal stress protein [Actinomycetota bacterium]
MIVVGVDGSPGSDAALRWALAEAELRAVPVRVVIAYQSAPVLADGLIMGGPGAVVAATSSDDLQRLRSSYEAEARRVLEEALARLDAPSNGVELEADAIEGPPAETLIESGRGADLLVVGSRGRGGFTGLLLGSVSQQCAQHPPCPVVILPPATETDEVAAR